MEWLLMRGRGEARLTSNRINKIVELSLEDIQGVAQDLVVVSFALGNQVQLLLHCTADGGEYQLCIYKPMSRCCCGHWHLGPATAIGRQDLLSCLTQSSWVPLGLFVYRVERHQG